MQRSIDTAASSAIHSVAAGGITIAAAAVQSHVVYVANVAKTDNVCAIALTRIMVDNKEAEATITD